MLGGHHDAVDPSNPVGSALGKLVRALPEPVAAQAEAVRRSAAAAPDRAAVRPDPQATTALVAARAQGRRIRFGYRAEAGPERIVEADPWAVVVRHGRWYLLCWSHTSDARRAYRIDRIRGVAVLDAAGGPPADLDPVATLEEHLADGWDYRAEVLIGSPVERLSPWLPRALGRLQPTAGGGCRLVGTTSNPIWYAEQLAALPGTFRVVGGPELRGAVRALAERLAASVS